MDTHSDTTQIRKAAKLTVAFTLLYSATFINVLLTKKHLLRQAQKANKSFDRYSSPLMRPADRLNANFLEWSPVFLGLVWSLAATETLPVTTAWVYLYLRFLYMVLVLKYGIATDGMNKALWISTFPAYACLLHLGVRGIQLFFR